jgi:hypothetical protein
VELENRDIPEEDTEDSGSDSDPSDDNLAQEEMFERVYELPAGGLGERAREREKQLQSLQRLSPVSGQVFFSRIKGQNVPSSQR